MAGRSDTASSFVSKLETLALSLRFSFFSSSTAFINCQVIFVSSSNVFIV